MRVLIDDNYIPVTKTSIDAPSEDEILEFRKRLLKPIPKDEIKKERPPTTIRGKLMKEMKDYFGTATNKEKKEQQ